MVKRKKQSDIERQRKAYVKKVDQLKEVLKDDKLGRLLDFDNATFYIANEYRIRGTVSIPIKVKDKDYYEHTYYQLERLINDVSRENKFYMYVEEVFDDEIMLKNIPIQTQLTSALTRLLLEEHFQDLKVEIVESIKLYDPILLA